MTKSQLLQEQVSANLSDLLAYAERRVVNVADAADALGDALEIIWKRASKVPSDAIAARMYMFVVMRNVLLNQNRALKNRSAATQRLALMLSQQGQLSKTSALRSDLVIDVARAIDLLPEGQAELIRLLHWDGFSIADAAKIMGINASTARGRYATARSVLRAALEPQDAPGGSSILSA